MFIRRTFLNMVRDGPQIWLGVHENHDTKNNQLRHVSQEPYNKNKPDTQEN